MPETKLVLLRLTTGYFDRFMKAMAS